MVIDIDENFYMKPDAGQLLISPANEDPMPPCDVQAEELDVAACIDKIETAFNLDVKSVVRKWAGLRSFVADKSPVIGFSNKIDRFFWLAGQGGYGVQSAPAVSRLAAAMLTQQEIPKDILDCGLDVNTVLPGRL